MLRATLRRLVGWLNRAPWRFAPAAATTPFLRHARTAFPFKDLTVAIDDLRVVESFAAYNCAPQDEHLIWQRGPLLLEPSYGFALTGPITLLLQSMPYYERVGLPQALPYLWQRFVRQRPVHHERCVISLREFGDDNYYHFYSDVLGRLALLDRWPETRELPILISRRLFERSYFQEALGRGPLARRRWIVHDGFVQADEVVLSKVMPHSTSTFDWLLQQLNPPPPDIRSNRRLFLTRGDGRGRRLANAEAVQALCQSFGFEVIDTDTLSLDEQMRCFAEARHVVGIHGAGLVNLIFRRGAPLSLLELFPPDNIPSHYFWICQGYGFAYDALVGSGSSDAGFTVDSDLLCRKIERMLHADAPLKERAMAEAL